MTRRLPHGGAFGGPLLREEASNRGAESERRVGFASAEHLLERDVDLLVEEFLIPFGTVSLDWEAATMSEPQTIDTNTFRDGIGNPVTVTRLRATLTVPLDGDALVFTYRSSHGAPGEPMNASVTPSSLQFTWDGRTEDGPEVIAAWAEKQRIAAERFIANNLSELDGHNEAMRARIRNVLERRRHDELARLRLASSLPFPVTRKPDAPRTVRAQRTIRVRPAPAGPGDTRSSETGSSSERSSPFKPEPHLELEVYEDILTDCVNMATVLERTPLGGWGEEQIRNLLLALLNLNYTGAVGGELFNGAGKTDLLIREADLNVFIGECKFYDGPKSVTGAIDQLLGYMVWRDTKGALLLFVRGGNFTEVVEKAVMAVAGHPQCGRQITTETPERRTDFLFTQADDHDRAIRLALLPFQIND